MGYLAWFEKGQRKFMLDGSDGVRLAPDFAPPSTEEDLLTAGGSMLNKFGGARLISAKAVNRMFGFGVHVEGDSSGEIQERVDTLDTFLRQDGDVREPVKLAYRPDDNFDYEPLFGQWGATRRLIVVRGAATYSPLYGMRTLRANRLPNCRVGMEILPFADGTYQDSGWASGGILEDWIGTVDHRSRGVMVPEETTNLYTNPVFGNSTWNNGWTASDVTLRDSQNLDREFILFGKCSAQLINSDSVNNRYYGQSLTPAAATTYTVSFYAKNPDKSAVTNADCAVWALASAQTSTYTAIGNGWYRVSFTFTGDGVARITGVIVRPSRNVLVDGFQLEAKAYMTPLAYGDLPGCAWTSTVHASTSTRTRAMLKYATGTWFASMRTIMVVWKANRASTTYSAAAYLLKSDTFLGLYWDSGTSKWTFGDGTNVISRSSGTDSWSAGDVLVFHMTLGPGSLKLYLNGSELATGSTYTPTAPGTYFYIGSLDGTANHSSGTFLAVSAYRGAFSAGEVAADYANVYAKATGGDGYGKRVSGLPYVWVKDGDAVVDNCDDSTRDNWGFVAGVQGTAPARTRWTLTPNVGTGMVNGDVLWLGLHKDRLEVPIVNSEDFYHDRNTTVDANSSGGGYDSASVPVVAGTDYPYFQVSSPRPWYLSGAFHLFARLQLASSTAGITATPYVGLKNGFMEGDDIVLPVTATWKAHYCGRVDIEQPEHLEWDDMVIKPGVVFAGSDASVTLRYDFMQVINGELVRVSVLTTRAPYDNQITYAYAATTSVVIEEDQVYGNSVDTAPELRGDILEVEPDTYNFYYVINNLASGHVITTTTKVEVGVTPRWWLG
jgi:hypothetical protein